jgi:D-alanyl-D-alanine carboxypeptidase/D-alanyl-D-alanine-endopeptidase (penicillin-binding protein 4)
MPGSWANGRVAAWRFLRRHDLPADGVRVDDGSGLSRENRLTTRLLATLLCKMQGHAGWEVWRNSLAVGGDSGTLRKRFRGELDGRVFAKTGYIRGVSSLGGYVELGGGRYVAFSFIYNDIPGSTWRAKQAQERACLALYRELREPAATQAGEGG